EVDVVDGGPVLAVHLDADEVLVEVLGDLLVAERLALHDVAPVARAVADRQEDELALLLGLGERLLAPRVPVHGVVGVLEQVGAGLAGEAVGGVLFLGRGGLLRLVGAGRRDAAAGGGKPGGGAVPGGVFAAGGGGVL